MRKLILLLLMFPLLIGAKGTYARDYTNYCKDANVAACWRNEPSEVSGSGTIVDITGTGNDCQNATSAGTLATHTSDCEDASGSCFEYLSAQTSYLACKNDSSLQLTTDFSVAFWWWKDYDDLWEVPVGKWKANNLAGWAVGHYTDDNNIIIAFRVDNGNYWSADGPALSLDTWYHIAFYYPGDGSTPTLWVNGTSEALTPWLTAGSALSGITDSGEALDIGRGRLFDTPYKYALGKIDEVIIYDGELTDTMVKDIYENGLK